MDSDSLAQKYRALASGVLVQAARDYVRPEISKKLPVKERDRRQREIRQEVQEFLRSPWGRWWGDIAEVDPVWLVSILATRPHSVAEILSPHPGPR